MSVAEVKEQIARMTAAERADVLRHLQLLRWKEDPETPGRVAAAHARMEAGRKVTQEQLETAIARRRKRAKE